MIVGNALEKLSSYRLLNLIKGTKDSWISGSSGAYCVASFNYQRYLELNHLYYQAIAYKFTTTNQSPTWSQFYIQGGMKGGPSVNNPVANTEYFFSTINQPSIVSASFTTSVGQVYNGPSTAIVGCTGYVKNAMMYDVTDLYAILLSNGIVTDTTTLKTWCDNNITYTNGTDYLTISLTLTDSVKINKGNILSQEYVEAEGMNFYSLRDSLRNNVYFDSSSGVGIYNNSGNGTVTHTRISSSSQNSPFAKLHPYILQIKTNGTATPDCGGFIAEHLAKANAIYIETFVAKVPKGYTVKGAYNSQGTGASVTNLTPMLGTGDWEEYKILYKCGTSGSFSTGGHVYLSSNGTVSGTTNTSVTWYLAYVNNCEITSNENLKYYTVLNPCRFKNNRVFLDHIDEDNLFPNGDAKVQSQSMFSSSSWTYDTEDVAEGSGAYASFVQPYNAPTGVIGDFIAIDPCSPYELEFWVKGINDMTSYLLAVYPYISTSSGAMPIYSWNYKSGTLTKLTKGVVGGDTTLSVESVANWITTSTPSGLGFRSNLYYYGHHNLGWYLASSYNTATSIDTTNKIITLRTSIPSGVNIGAGNYVCLAWNGANYPYPVSKSDLPTDNTWKHIKVTINNRNTPWSGDSGSPTNAYLPATMRYIRLCFNLYTNTSATKTPLKFCGIKLRKLNRDGRCSTNIIKIPTII